MSQPLRLGSACTGYAGLDMAVAAVLEVELAWVADNDPGAAAILAHHHPDVPNLGDITAVDWTAVPPIDVLCGGYPCQPFSAAGKRKGTADERHLWPHIAAALRVLRPRIAIFENVSNHLRLGFADVLADLAGLGFDAEWCLVRASEVGAPHQRARLFVVASAQDPHRATGGERRIAASRQAQGGRAWPDAGRRGGAPAPDPEGDEQREPAIAGPVWPQPRHGASGAEWGPYGPAIDRWSHIIGRPAPRPVEPGRTGDRLSPHFVEWLMGLPAGWVTAVPGLTRNQQLKAGGNGVVPQQGAAALALLLDRIQEGAAA